MNLPNLFFLTFVLCWLLALRNSFLAKPRHPRTWRTTAVLLTIGLSFVTGATWIGSTVDQQGFLHEPFFLIRVRQPAESRWHEPHHRAAAARALLA